MLHVRLDLITADPLTPGGVHHLHEREVRPAAESRPGRLGLSLLASPEAGAAVLESFWASRDALAETTGLRQRVAVRRPGFGSPDQRERVAGRAARAASPSVAAPAAGPDPYEAPAADPNLIRIV
jgi:hypothetical protein